MSKIKRVIHNIMRNKIKKDLTNNLGRIVEDDEYLTCYVDKAKIRRKDGYAIIPCSSINEYNEDFKEMLKAFNLNKPIRYVIKNIIFGEHSFIFGYNDCEVIIQNCRFISGTSIRINGKCDIENTSINAFGMLSINASTLIINNMHIRNFLKDELQIDISTKNKLDIINSNIGDKQDVKVNLVAGGDLNITNSNITGTIITCHAKRLTTDKDSSLVAEDKVDLKIDEYDTVNITSPTIILNGNELLHPKENLLLKKVTDPLTLKRMELLEVLKKISSKAKEATNQEVEEFRAFKSSRPISRILKQKND